MNDVCQSLLHGLNSQEYYTFLKMGLGMQAFLLRKEINPKRSLFVTLGKENNQKKKQNAYFLARKGIDNVNITFLDNQNFVYHTETFFEEMDQDLLECLLRAAKSDLDWAELYPDEKLLPGEDLHPSEEVFDPRFGRKILDAFIAGKYPFQFIKRIAICVTI